MNKRLLLPVLALLGGGGAFALRLLQCRTGFEAATGLPVAGNPWAPALAVLLAVLAAVFWLLTRGLPDEKDAPPPDFARAFSAAGAGVLTLLVCGVLLLAVSGALELLQALGVLPLGRAAHSPQIAVVLGSLTLLSALCLFPAVAAGRSRPDRSAGKFSGNPLLVPVAYLVIRLVLTYRADSIDPSLEAYYVELLALVFLTLAFYRLSAFAFRAGRTRRFALWSALAVTLSMATLADGHSLPVALLYAAGALLQLGFLLLRLRPAPDDSTV